MNNRALPLTILAVVIIGVGLGYLFFFRPSQLGPSNGEKGSPNGDTEILFRLTTGDKVTIGDLLLDEKTLGIYFFAT